MTLTLWDILNQLHAAMQDDKFKWMLEQKIKQTKEAVDDLSRASPFLGRILTKNKIYTGKIEKLKLNLNGRLEFEFMIRDRDKVYQEKIPLKDLENIQLFYDQKGKLQKGKLKSK